MPITPKELKALADACRKAGITSFKGQGIEFTLGALAPKPKKTRNPKPTATIGTTATSIVPETEEMSQEDLLFWSIGDDTQESPGEQ